MKKLALFILIALLGPSGKLEGQQRRLDVTTFVVLGEGLAAGMAEFALKETYQTRSFPAQMARQMQTAFPQPLIQAPGLGNVAGFAPLPVRVPATLQTTVRESPPNLFVFNLSVPGFKLSDSLGRRPAHPLIQDDALQTLTNFILGFPALLLENVPLWTQVEYAQRMFPTLALIQLGYFDVLDPVVRGDLGQLPEVSSFQADFSRLVSPLRGTFAEVVVMTIPDPTDTGYFTPVAEATRLVGAPPEVIQQLWGVGADDLIAIGGLVAMGNQILAREIQPLPPNSILPAGDAAEIGARVAALNSAIASVAQQHGAVVYDLHGFFRQIRNQGVRVGSRELTAQFLGGFYSLNGFYPGMVGHGLLANDVLDLLNRTYGESFAPVDVQALLEEDPAVRSAPFGGPGYTVQEMQEIFPQLLRQREALPKLKREEK